MATSSVKEVAARAGVSVGTVSNVLNHPERVSEATRQRVLDTIRDLGFVRNESARALRAGQSRLVGLVVLDVANPFFTDVARGAEAVADATGSVLMLCHTGENPARERRYLDMLEEQRVQGILITPVEVNTPRIEALIERGMPVVLLDRGAGTRNTCSVAVDDVLGGRLATTHLLERGHRRIAFVGGSLAIAQVKERRDGAAAAVAGWPEPAELVVMENPHLTVAAGRRSGAEIAERLAMTGPTAVFCANDLLALGVLQEFAQRGVRVPEQVAIVGYDDIDFASAATVPLSSVRQPREELGRTAAQLLHDEVTGGARHRHRQVVFQPDLVVRESSDHQRP